MQPLVLSRRVVCFLSVAAEQIACMMAYKRLEDTTFTWPAIKDGVIALNHAQFEALFAGLDWRKVKALDVRPPAAAE